jgi:transcriptional regulator with XRE-family HTH domain
MAVPSDEEVSRALGQELRRAREEKGWSRLQLAARLPSRITDRTLLSYEHGTRHLTVVRFFEICRVLEVDGPSLARRALQRARILLENMALEVDLRTLLNDRSDAFRAMAQWARNSLVGHPTGVVEVAPDVVRHLALFIGCSHHALANHLARFTPDDYRSVKERHSKVLNGRTVTA